jgi:hypothetical protein
MAEKRIPIEKFLPLCLKAAEEESDQGGLCKKVGLKPSKARRRRCCEVQFQGHRGCERGGNSKAKPTKAVAVDEVKEQRAG